MTDDPTGRDAPQPRVTDRRRFRPDGEPVAEPGEGAGAPQPAPDDPAATARAQAARIDELTRAYAALVEDNKAFRQRLEREKERVLEAERVKVAQALLEAHDGLELALGASRAAGEPEGPALRSLSEGVRLTLQGLEKRISDLGAERIDVVGRPFDPRVAEAVDVVGVADPARDEVVVEEARAGWRIGDRVLRPARVRVGRLARA